MIFWFIVSSIVTLFCGTVLACGMTGFGFWFFTLGGEIVNLFLIRYFISDNCIDSEDSATKVMCIIGTVFWIIGLSIAFLISPDSKNVVLPWILIAGILVAPYLIVASLDAFFDDSLWAIILIGIAKLTSSVFLYMGTLNFIDDVQKMIPGKTIVSFVIIGVLASLIWIPIIFEKISSAVKGWLERKKRKEEQRKISYSNQLISAAGNNDKFKVLDMLDLGADVNYENSDGKTPLLNAAISGSLDVASLLIDKGANVSCKDADKKTPLIAAVENNNKDMVSLLWKRGANINSRNSSGKTALDYAIENENEDIISFLLEKGADIGNDDSNIKNLLDFAIKYDKDDLLSLLAEKAAYIARKNRFYFLQ